MTTAAATAANASTCQAGSDDLELRFPVSQQESIRLPDGSALYTFSGRITNRGTIDRTLPNLFLVFRTSTGAVIYAHEVDMQHRVLAPGETHPVNEAIVDLPRAAQTREIGWSPCNA